MAQSPADIEWEDDPNTFIFHNEKDGKVKMHLFPLDLDDWIRIDSTYPAQMKQRKQLLSTEIAKVFVTTTDRDSTKQCEEELFELVYNFLPARFPSIFEQRGNGIYNRATDEFIAKDGHENPIIRASRLTQEDWCIMEWSDDASGYVLTSGVVCFPMRWSLTEKHGMVMGRVHEPVHAFTKHLKVRAYDVMKNLKVENPVWRANWAIFNDLDGPDDLFTPKGHEERNGANNKTRYQGHGTGKDLVFRAEYQTLRKLPKTNCIAFSIRTYQRFLSDFKDLPRNDSEALLRAIQGLDSDMAAYKGAQFWQDAAIKYLQHDVLGHHQDQRGPSRQMLTMMMMALLVVVIGVCIVSTGRADYYR